MAVADVVQDPPNSGRRHDFEFARAIFELSGMDPELVSPCRSSDFPLPAERPAYSVLAHDTGAVPMPPWRDALERFLEMA